MEPTSAISTGHYAGSASEPIPWQIVEGIFDMMFGSDRHHLPRYPQSLDSIWSDWADGAYKYQATHLSDVQEAYENHRTGNISFVGRLESGLKGSFHYQPGEPKPRAEVLVEGTEEEVERVLNAVRPAFPLPYEGALVFISWGGKLSLQVARVLRELLVSRFPASEVFLSESSIDPGDDPLRRILEEGVLKAEVLVAPLTREAASRPWVVWETACAWARGKLVVPIFVDVEPKDVPGPLAIKVQGVHLAKAEEINRALEVLAQRVGLPLPEPLSSVEHRTLIEAAENVPDDPASSPKDA
jgi:hypothetical protein